MALGRIIKQISNCYYVLDDKVYECVARGKFRKEKVSPFVGDFVCFDKDAKVITSINSRKNNLIRPNVANVDLTVIVMSLKEPFISLYLLDKLIVASLLRHIMPVVCFTKLDLASSDELAMLDKYRLYYESIGIKCYDNLHLDVMLEDLRGLVVLTGQSGAGKSTLINKICPSLNLKTNDISYALNRGKHTTRHIELYKIRDFYLCDTPGFSALDLKGYSKEDIKEAFKEFLDYDCRFGDCMHVNESGCMVKDAVLDGRILSSRYDNYLLFLKEVSDGNCGVLFKK